MTLQLQTFPANRSYSIPLAKGKAICELADCIGLNDYEYDPETQVFAVTGRIELLEQFEARI